MSDTLPRLNFQSLEQCSLEGCISFDTVLGIHQEFMQKIQNMATSIPEPQLSVDLAQLETMDASVLAMFIDWIREATAHKIKLSFYNAPQPLLTIARISRLDHLFLDGHS